MQCAENLLSCPGCGIKNEAEHPAGGIPCGTAMKPPKVNILFVHCQLRCNDLMRQTKIQIPDGLCIWGPGQMKAGNPPAVARRQFLRLRRRDRWSLNWSRRRASNKKPHQKHHYRQPFLMTNESKQGCTSLLNFCELKHSARLKSLRRSVPVCSKTKNRVPGLRLPCADGDGEILWPAGSCLPAVLQAWP